MPRILIADDDRLIRWTLSEILSGEGYGVVAVDSGAQALAEISAGGVDVVITDYNMPEVNGLDVLRRTKTSSPHTHVILITGYRSPLLERTAREIGVFDYFDKPFDVRELVGSVARALAIPRAEGGPSAFGNSRQEPAGSGQLAECSRQPLTLPSPPRGRGPG